MAPITPAPRSRRHHGRPPAPEGQVEREGVEALARGDRDPPLHALRELAGDRQAEAGAADRVAGVEALEHPLLDPLRNSRALVGDGQGGALVLVVGRHGHLGALGRVGEGVVEQDTDDLARPVGVGERQRALLGGPHLRDASRDGRRPARTPAPPPGRARRGRPARPTPRARPRRGARGRAGRWSAWSAGRPAGAWCARTPPGRPGSGSSSSSSSTKPPSEKIGVRSSCEALAMNCLRALSRSASRRCISLKVSASCPSSSPESTGIGVAKSPSATFWAASSSLLSRRESARAA